MGRLVHVTARHTGVLRLPEARQPTLRVRAIAGVLLLAIGLGSMALAISGADPLLRIGPSAGIFRLPATPGGKLTDPGSPGSVETVPASGQVVSRTYHSLALGEERRYLIYLPPTYGLRAAAKRHYPVLYLLHGDPSSPSEWVGLGAPALFDAGVARGSLPAMILVMPDGNGLVTTATQWADRADGRDRIESALLELVDVVDREYRTIPDRGHRVIAGLSSGGFGAANIAARNPERFGTAMSFAGTFVANGPVFGTGPSARANSPYFRVQDQPAARSVRFIVVVGSSDAWRRQAAEQFANQLTRFGVSHELSYLPGGHAPSVWIGGLALGIQRMAEPLSLPGPGLSDDTRHARW
jgi:enterochelin esterase-like enzyme